MSNIYMLLNTAKTSMMTNQLAFEVSGHNIANTNNDEYNLQSVDIRASYPVIYGSSPGMIGTGVRAVSIFRNYNSFLESERLSSSSSSSYSDQMVTYLSSIESFLNESGDGQINALLDRLFQSFKTLASNPSLITGRTMLIESAVILSSSINKLSLDLNNLKRYANNKIISSVDKVNELIQDVSRLNKVIHETEVYNVKANDLRDKRDGKIKELASYLTVRSVEEPTNNQVTLYTADGTPLVIGQSLFRIEAGKSSDDTLADRVYILDVAGGRRDITDDIKGGSLGALINVRDNHIDKYLERLNILAATLTRDINNIHQAGYGLGGSTGVNFFKELKPIAYATADNQGSGLISLSVTAPDKLNINKFEISYNGASYDIRDLTEGKDIMTAVSLIDIYDKFKEYGLDINISGSLIAGDRFIVNSSKDAAFSFKVDDMIVKNEERVAAGLTLAKGDGDNANMIANLQNNKMVFQGISGSNGLYTYQEYYQSMVGRIGITTAQANSDLTQQKAISNNLEFRRQQVSGVSLDEEMVKIIKFQASYRASAKIISTANELLDSLINISL